MNELQVQYTKILGDYLKNPTEYNLYIGQNFIRQLIQKNISPEEFIQIHKSAILNKVPNLPDTLTLSYDFLIEIMVHFGLKIKENQSLHLKQEEMRIEMDIATRIQNKLLKTPVPNVDEIDIGMVSIPLRKMNGDYVHFLHEDENYVSVAVTDVVGKGVPAALCMSMVKYGLDTLEYADNNPSHVLEVLNRIIEKSVDDSMFVSMFYGRYDLKQDIFTFGSAGHEPALYYNAETETFHDLEAKGLLLGVIPDSIYSQAEIRLKENDFIIMITDGVTEFRAYDDFDSRGFIKMLALSCKQKSAQEMAELIYKEVQKMKKFDLEDDFTVVVVKK